MTTLTPIVDTSAVGPAVMRDMRMEVGERRRQRLIDLNLPGLVDGPWAMEIHRRLVDPVEVHERGFAAMAVIEAPPVAWEVLERWLLANASAAPLGVRKADRHEVRSMVSLGIKIRAELDRLSRHPGYHGVSVLGLEPLVLPAFRVVDPDVVGPLAPTPGRALASGVGGVIESGVLAPYALKVRGEGMTTWIFEPESVAVAD